MRLTERKTIYPECDKQGNLTKVDCIDIKDKKMAEEKLCQLEDIEEELGIDLITLFKGLKNGIYFWDCDEEGNHFCKEPKLRYFGIRATFHLIDYNGTYSHTDDYGLTWALTKEELL